jgi:hypothetical protein
MQEKKNKHQKKEEVKVYNMKPWLDEVKVSSNKLEGWPKAMTVGPQLHLRKNFGKESLTELLKGGK